MWKTGFRCTRTLTSVRCAVFDGQTFADFLLDPLAYMTAKAHGLEEECQAILEASGLTEDQVTLPSFNKPVVPPKAIVSTFKANWPTKAASSTVFEDALSGKLNGGEEQTSAAASNGFMDESEDLPGESQQNGHVDDEDGEDAGGWDMGDDVVAEPEADVVKSEKGESGAGSSEADIWARTSPVAADHVAGGSFESAMQLLNRQVGAVNFDPLQARFVEIYQASRTFLPASAGMSPLINYVRRIPEETDPRKIQPIIPRDLESITTIDLPAGKNCMRTNKLDDGVKNFKRILHLLLVNAVSSPQEAAEVRST